MCGAKRVELTPFSCRRKARRATGIMTKQTSGVLGASACPELLLKRLQKLDSVPEWVEDIDAVESREGFVRHRWKPGGAAPGREFCQTAHQDCRVRLAGCPEVRVYTEMKAQCAAAKPDATAGREIRRFGFLNQDLRSWDRDI
jgi:hypothetical protein